MRNSNLAARNVLLAIAVIAPLFWTAGDAAAEEPLRWKFKVGEKLAFNLTQDMVMNIEAGQSGRMTNTMHQVIDMTWNVQGVNEQGEAVIVEKFDRIQMIVAGPRGQGFDYDSASDKPPTGMAALIAPLYSAMTEGEFEATMTSRGEVRDVRVPDDVVTAIKTGPGTDAAAHEGAVEAFKAMITQGAFILPENSPTPGQEWSTNVSVKNPSFGGSTVETTYRYEGNREVDGKNYAVIRPTLKMDVAGNDVMQMKMKEQKTEGEALFDPAAGRLNTMSIAQDVSLEISMAGQTMPGTIKQKIDVKVAPK